jgi:hypothetical protein
MRTRHRKSFPDTQASSVIEHYSLETTVCDTPITFTLWDVAGLSA